MADRIGADELLVKQNLQSKAVNPQPTTKQETKTPIFMADKDVSTVKPEDAKKIGDFLNSKEARAARQVELENYLLTQKTEGGYRKYTVAQAEELAKYQVKNEMEQAKAKVTIPFTNEEQYKAFKQTLKEQGAEKLYNVTLIKNKKVLGMINQNPEKYYLQDKNGQLVKDKNGAYILDPDKYKAEMVQDTSAYRLTLKDRAEHAQERGISKNAEKDAVKTAGLAYKKDRTWLYRSLMAGGAVAAGVFGGATATAVATADAAATGGCSGANADAAAKAVAHNHLGQILGAAGMLIGAAFVKDKDAKTNHRLEAYDAFKQPEQAEKPEETPPVQQEPEKPEEPVKPENPVQETPQVQPEEECDPPCMKPQELPATGKKIPIIKGGGPYHYAQLYVDADGKPIKKGTPLFKELQKKLSAGEFAIKNVDRQHRELAESIDLKGGTVHLADNAAEKAKKGFADARVVRGTGDRKYARVKRNGKWIVVYCTDGKQVPGTGKYDSAQDAQNAINKAQAKK